MHAHGSSDPCRDVQALDSGSYFGALRVRREWRSWASHDTREVAAVTMVYIHALYTRALCTVRAVMFAKTAVSLAVHSAERVDGNPTRSFGQDEDAAVDHAARVVWVESEAVDKAVCVAASEALAARYDALTGMGDAAHALAGDAPVNAVPVAGIDALLVK